MVDIVTRVAGANPKGAPLSNAEIDGNFINLKNAIEESSSKVIPLDRGGTGSITADAARNSLDVPSKTGEGASGTWNISVTGDVQWGKTKGKPNRLPGYGLNEIRGATNTAFGYTGELITSTTEVIDGNTKSTSILYNADNTIKSVEITYLGLKRTETFTYTGGKIAGTTATEVIV